MPHGDRWLPGMRVKQLAMAKNWGTRAAALNVPASEVTELVSLTGVADTALAESQSGERTPVITAKCKEAFDALVAKMRFIKNHYFLSPPLTDADIISLELKPRDTTHSPIPTPSIQAEADVSWPGIHLVELHLRSVSGTPPDPHRSDYGFRIYYGIMAPGGSTVEAADGAKQELKQVPISGEELPFSIFTRRKKERFEFRAEDSGKTVYFCIRYENAKGKAGPWGPMFKAVIP